MTRQVSEHNRSRSREDLPKKSVCSRCAWKTAHEGVSPLGCTALRAEGMSLTDKTFAELGVAQPLLQALAAEDYHTPTPIQARAIPALLAGKDMLGIAQTGTGKTAAFALPLLQRLAANRQSAGPRRARVLVLAPTRELAIQIHDSFKTYGCHLNLRHTVVYGGVGQQPQVKAMARGVDTLVATPGRLLDLMQQGHIVLDRVAYLVLDEADRMLDMGFIRDVRRIVATLPKERQSLLFSATMPAEVERLAADMLRQPVRVEVTPNVVTVDRVDQRVLFVETRDKRAALARLLRDPALSRVLVFTRTKHGANRVSADLDKAGIAAAAIHGNKSQQARQRALEGFRAGQARVLVATDIAARGIDVDGVSHVINYELPHEPESYVHRIGRTARAGAAGVALSLCDASERGQLRAIERLIRRPLAVDGPKVEGQKAVAAQVRPATPAPVNTQNRAARPGARRRRGPGGQQPRAA
jgi:ATP-dependent RNA helicase RhlE